MKKNRGSGSGSEADAMGEVAKYALSDFWNYANKVPLAEIEFIQEAYDANLELAGEGAAANGRTVICQEFIADNHGLLCSDDALASAQAMTAAAIEARVRGVGKPAMSITGSGNHGIICTMPLCALARAKNLPKEKLLRATALSYLVTMYIKEYSGTLSAFCGCAIAAGTGAFVGWLFLSGGTLRQASLVIDNMASSLTGIICTGGNPACVLKAAIAVDMGYKAVKLALRDVAVETKHGINGLTPEKTMRNMGRIASPGMEQTEKAIVEIMEEKELGIA
jgi:L-cysteine desulfidase